MRRRRPEFQLKLPDGYRAQEVLAFHGRDPGELAERTSAGALQKAFVINGVPLVLNVSLRPGAAECLVEAQGSLDAAAIETLRGIAGNLLGLSIDPAPFEMAAKRDPLLGPLLKKQAGLRIPQMATAFETLTWAIIGQQIHLSFALSLRRTLIQLAGQRHPSGLWCHPEAAAVAQLDPEELTKRKFSRAKAETVIRAAQLVASGKLPLSQWSKAPPSQIEAALLAIKGIGPWTVNYTLMRAFGYSDCSLHGDAAVRNAIHRLQGSGTKPTSGEVQTLLERYKPYRSLAAVHLWASLRAFSG
jgi:DNA-3-methyladenine glycosylase II